MELPESLGQRRKSKYLDVLWKVCLLSFCQRQNFGNTLCLLQNARKLLQKKAFFMFISPVLEIGFGLFSADFGSI